LVLWDKNKKKRIQMTIKKITIGLGLLVLTTPISNSEWTEDTNPFNLKISSSIVAPKSELERSVIAMLGEEQSFETRLINELFMGESSGVTDTINSIGALGGWSIMPYTLNELDINKNNFLKDSVMQRMAVRLIMDKNRKSLHSYIKHLSGKTIKSVPITESGILAAAWLAGPTGVKKWFNYGINAKDINGASIESYMIKYSY
jgi:hypothetical protein